VEAVGRRGVVDRAEESASSFVTCPISAATSAARAAVPATANAAGRKECLISFHRACLVYGQLLSFGDGSWALLASVARIEVRRLKLRNGS
jgi:hypothetical protein